MQNFETISAFNSVFESSSDCLKILNLDGGLERINSNGCKLMEVDDVESIRNSDWLSFWKGPDASSALFAFEKAKNGENSSFSGLCPTAKGSDKFWSITLSPIFSEDGKVSSVLSISKDVTEELAQNKLLLNYKSRLDLATEVAGIGIWEWDTKTDKLLFSDSEWDLLSLNALKDHYTGEEFFSRIDPKDVERIAKEMEAAKVKKEIFKSQFRFRDGNEEYMWLASAGVYLELDENNGLWIGTNRDITKEVDETSALRVEKKKAENASAIKSKFVANVSHEIRNPMNSILGFADLLCENLDEASEEFEYAVRIKSSGDHLLRLLNDILDISKIESGQLVVEKKPVEIRDLLENCAESLHVLAENKDIYLKANIPSNLPKKIVTDESRLRQVLVNMISNAIKFTEEGGVEVVVDFEKESEEKGQLKIDFIDSGIGIDASNTKKLFGAFSQTDETIHRKYGGTGLGLHLSRMIAKSLGGKLFLSETKLGEGTVFTFKMPVDINSTFTFEDRKVDEARNLKIIKTEFLKGKKILIADDIKENRRLLGLYLKSTGAQIDYAINGVEVLELAKVNDYDLILMDILMPEMSGIEATKALRKTGFKKPVIALTAHAMRVEVEKCINAGCNYHLSKPLRKEALLKCLNSYIN